MLRRLMLSLVLAAPLLAFAAPAAASCKDDEFKCEEKCTAQYDKDFDEDAMNKCDAACAKAGQKCAEKEKAAKAGDEKEEE